MSRIAKSVLKTIGRTPLVELSGRTTVGAATVLAKVVFFNAARCGRAVSLDVAVELTSDA